MAQRYFTSQFQYSFERQPVRLMGSFIQSGSAGTAAVLASQGVTYTAVRFGTAGNSITVTITGGATAGAEVVTVANKAISVQIETGVSSITQVRTAVNASAAAAALVTATGTSASAVSTHTVQSLATGTDTAFTQVGGQSAMTLSQIATGTYEIALADPYAALLDIDLSILSSSAADLITQIKSADPTSASKTIVFRTQTAASAANLASGQGVYIGLTLRNSANRTSSTP